MLVNGDLKCLMLMLEISDRNQGKKSLIFSSDFTQRRSRYLILRYLDPLWVKSEEKIKDFSPWFQSLISSISTRSTYGEHFRFPPKTHTFLNSSPKFKKIFVIVEARHQESEGQDGRKSSTCEWAHVSAALDLFKGVGTPFQTASQISELTTNSEPRSAR